MASKMVQGSRGVWLAGTRTESWFLVSIAQFLFFLLVEREKYVEAIFLLCFALTFCFWSRASYPSVHCVGVCGLLFFSSWIFSACCRGCSSGVTGEAQ